MARSVITLRELGEASSWMLVKQAMGMPDAKMASNFMTERVVLLLFNRQSLPERLCATAAVRQMGGTTIYQGETGGTWSEEIITFQEQFLPVLSYYLDSLYIYGYSVKNWHQTDNIPFPVINAGSPEAHPAHVLADLACMLRKTKNLREACACWLGCPNGTLYSLVEAMPWFGFSLKLCLPPDTETDILKARIRELNVPVEFVDNPEQAVKGCLFIYAGRRNENRNSRDYSLTTGLMQKAAKDAWLLLSASPLRAITVDPQILSSRASQLTRQAEYRLCVHKRILHYVLG